MMNNLIPNKFKTSVSQQAKKNIFQEIDEIISTNDIISDHNPLWEKKYRRKINLNFHGFNGNKFYITFDNHEYDLTILIAMLFNLCIVNIDQSNLSKFLNIADILNENRIKKTRCIEFIDIKDMYKVFSDLRRQLGNDIYINGIEEFLESWRMNVSYTI